MRQPCKRECPEREVGCHGKCEKWQAYEAWKAEEYKRRYEDSVNCNSQAAKDSERRLLIQRWKYGRK